MFHRRYSHGHSAVLGFLLALSLYGHALVFALLVFAAGLATGRAWAWWALAASALREKWHLAQRRRIPVRPPVLRKPSAQTDDVPF